jgi:hypothetical protein
MKLADIRLEFDNMNSIAKDIDDELSTIVIGLLEINFGNNYNFGFKFFLIFLIFNV